MATKLDIIVLTGVSAGDVFHYNVEPGDAVTIGRSDECDLVLQDPTASRRHARIALEERGFVVEDLGSSHGTVHMGFQLQGGDRRSLGDDDEFKVGDVLFRANYDEAPFRVASKPESSAEQHVAGPLKKRASRKTMLIGLLGLVLLLVVGSLLLGDDAGGPALQKSGIVMSMPQEVVIGNYSEGRGAGKSDRSHLDKAQFALPASDVLVEFEFIGETAARVLVDDALVDELPPFTSGWERHAMVSRDILSGLERKFIVDNTDYPKQSGKPKLWAVKNVRALPMTRAIDANFDKALVEAVALVEKLTQSPPGVFFALRGVQRAMLEALHETNQDAFHYTISIELPPPDAEELRQQVETVLNARQLTHDTAAMDDHLRRLARVAAPLEAELWRAYNYTIFNVPRLVKAKNYIGAFDLLTELQGKIPDESDLRWIAAERMISDKKIVPAKVRSNPGRYRKKS